MECRVAQLARARSLVGFVLHTGGGRRFESAHGNEFLFIAHFDSGVLYVSRHRYRAELNVKQLSFRLNPKSERMLRAGSGQPLPLFQMRKRKKTNKNQNATIMKDYLNNSERDPKRDAIEREDWVVYGIIAPVAFIIILGVGEAIGRIFG